jgi:hypothetical protein
MTFWDVQVNAIKCLSRLNIMYRLQDRIPIFSVWTKLNRLELDPKINETFLLDAKDSLNGILLFRNQGIEPENIKGVYVVK